MTLQRCMTLGRNAFYNWALYEKNSVSCRCFYHQARMVPSRTIRARCDSHLHGTITPLQRLSLRAVPNQSIPSAGSALGHSRYRHDVSLLLERRNDLIKRFRVHLHPLARHCVVTSDQEPSVVFGSAEDSRHDTDSRPRGCRP